METQLFADCMKRYMEKQGITTEILAEKTSMTIERLEEYESGSFKPVSSELEKIANALNVPLMVMMHGGGLIHKLSLDKDGKKVSSWEKY